MAKKKPTQVVGERDGEPSGGGTGIVVALLLGACLGALGTSSLGPSGPGPAATAPASPEPDRSNLTDTQRIAVANLESQVDAALQTLKEEPDLFPTEDKSRRLILKHPAQERWLFGFGVARPDAADRWSLAVVRAGKDPLAGTLPKQGLDIEAVFEIPGAQGMEAAAFNETGSVALVLTRSVSRAKPPGELFRLVPGEAHARRIDSNVFRFTLAPDGDAIVYERSVQPGDDFGPRELKIYHASRGRTQLIKPIAFPKEQLGALGPWGPGGVYLGLSLVRYGSASLAPESVTSYTLDPFNPSNFTELGKPAASPGSTGP